MPGSELSYYDLLGLKPDASHDEIRAAYDSLMARIRPDIAQDSASTIRLAAAVKQAWETLGDADKRHAYDESLRGTAAYADIWRRSEQASYLEKRDEWLDKQVRRAQSDRQSAFEVQAERRLLEEESMTVAASHTSELARESEERSAAARMSASRKSQAQFLQTLAAVVAIALIVAAGAMARGWMGRQSAAPPGVPSKSAGPEATGVAAAPARTTRTPNRTRLHVHGAPIAPGPARTSDAAGASAPVGTTQAHPSPVQPTHISAGTRSTHTVALVSRSHRRSSSPAGYVCRSEVIASVARDGATVDLGDGNRYQLSDPVDRAQAAGWRTGNAVAECAWPAAMKRPASLDVNGYTVRATVSSNGVATDVAATVATAPASTSAAPACADASISDVSQDGYGLTLSDGHAYAVDSAGHVTASAWLAGDAVSVCSRTARGAKTYTVARFGSVVNAARTQSFSTAAAAPTLCVVRLIAALAGDGSRVTFNDANTYRVESVSGRAVVAGWTVGERITVCIKLASGMVYATLAHGSLSARAIRAN